MKVKGTVIVTGKVAICAYFGEERWNSFMAALARKDAYFKNVIMAITLVPVEKHLFFLDEMINEFFNNDTKQYIIFGKFAAKYALSPGGPYNSYLLAKDMKQFIENAAPRLWDTYYDGGALVAKLENNVVHIKITQIPNKHIYFEYMFTGYVQQSIKIFGKKSVERCIKGFSKGDDEIYYQYELQDA